MDINNIISGCHNKRPDAERALVKNYSGLLFTLCRRYCFRQMDARDVLQDAFLIIFKNFHQFDQSKGQLEHWMKRVTINVALQHNRSKKIYAIEISEENQNIPREEALPIDNLSTDEIIELIAKLPTKYRTVFNLYVIDGFSHKEIAVKLDINEASSRSNLSRAKSILKKNILENKTYDSCRITN